jgi:hypothetical protein
MGRFNWAFIKTFIIFKSPQIEYFIIEISMW